LCCKKCVRANEFEQTKPDHFNNSFAGVDKDAVDAAREQMFLPPSSPSMALFKTANWFTC
jgi:putative YphP/YqiW family bacilliredoxin